MQAAAQGSSSWPGKRLYWHVEADIPVAAGNNAVTLVATDVSNNTTTKNYTVNVAGTGATYTYDLNGNLATKTEGSTTWTYEWTAENQLKRVLNNGSEVARFAYDPVGRRVEKITTTGTTTWTYDGEDILRENGATSLKYVHGPGIDEPLAQEDSAGVLTAVHADDLGSVIKNSNALGLASGARRYDAWGNTEIGGTASGYAFTGREHDAETGLAYYRARYYDPRLGRFLSEDPLFWIDTPNLYAYVGNNPVNWIDPSGEAAMTNNSGRAIPVKPEGGSDTRLCMPGQTCDVDGVYPPACKDYPIKIVDGCTSEVTPDGKLIIRCPKFDKNAPGKRKFPRAGQKLTGGPTNKDFHDKNKDWPPPNNQPNCGCTTPYGQ